MTKLKQIKVYFSPDDYDIIKSKAAAENVSMAELIRREVGLEIENAPAPKSTHREAAATADPALLYELKKIGNNLNQIAKKVNAENAIDRATLAVLVSIEKEMKLLL